MCDFSYDRKLRIKGTETGQKRNGNPEWHSCQFFGVSTHFPSLFTIQDVCVFVGFLLFSFPLCYRNYKMFMCLLGFYFFPLPFLYRMFMCLLEKKMTVESVPTLLPHYPSFGTSTQGNSIEL